MEAFTKKRFIKDLLKIPADFRTKIEAFVFEESAAAESVESIQHKIHYRPFGILSEAVR